jgi:hypothetical protein
LNLRDMRGIFVFFCIFLGVLSLTNAVDVNEVGKRNDIQTVNQGYGTQSEKNLRDIQNLAPRIRLIRDLLARRLAQNRIQLDGRRHSGLALKGFGSHFETERGFNHFGSLSVPVTPNGPIPELDGVPSGTGANQVNGVEKRPKAFFEVIRVDKNMIIDKDTHRIGFLGADVHKSLYALSSGRLHRILATHSMLLPRNGQPVFMQEPKSQPRVFMSGQEFEAGLRGSKDSRVLSRLLISFCFGFLATMVVYILFVVLFRLYSKHCGKESLYSEVSQRAQMDRSIVDSEITSSDSLIEREQKRMNLALPVIPTI